MNNNVYILTQVTLNTTHKRRRRGYDSGMTLKLRRSVCVGYLHICAKFNDSLVNRF